MLKICGRIYHLRTWAERLHAGFHGHQLRQPTPIEEAMGRQALALMVVLDAACQAAADLHQATVTAFRDHPDHDIVTSFPGLGELTAARLVAEIGDDRTRFADARALKAYAGAAPITRASGRSRAVVHRRVKNRRLTASPGARVHYDRRKEHDDRHSAALRNLYNRFRSCLFHCLTTRQPYSEPFLSRRRPWGLHRGPRARGRRLPHSKVVSRWTGHAELAEAIRAERLMVAHLLESLADPESRM
ncbi:transposase [Nonomuraea sp. ZG12]|uniref:transposase n=1 Tax=Nonomuraea sp. ZG12 TaxID=3452207 RepID=UPI003F888336